VVVRHLSRRAAPLIPLRPTLALLQRVLTGAAGLAVAARISWGGVRAASGPSATEAQTRLLQRAFGSTPRGQDGAGDVDSGPLLLGVSASAST